MPALNRVQLIGRLGNKPTTHYTPSGKKITSFNLAVGQRWRGKEGETRETTDWFHVETYGRLGEICEQYLGKGRLIYIEGRLRTSRSEQDGVTRYFTKVVANQMQILDRKQKEVEPVIETVEEEIGVDTETTE